MQIVVLPGLDGTGQLVGPFCAALVGHDVTALSYPAVLVTYDTLVDWVEAQLPNGDFILVAESFSGPVAAMLAVRELPGLKGVVFVATFASCPRFIPEIGLRMAKLLPLTSRVILRAMQPLVMGRWRTPTFFTSFVSALSTVKPSTLRRRLAAVRQVNTTSAIAGMGVPHVYLQATHDRLVPRKAADHFSGVIAVPGPHFLLQANPVAAAEAVHEFINGFGP